jgi:hypothetical protein
LHNFETFSYEVNFAHAIGASVVGFAGDFGLVGEQGGLSRFSRSPCMGNAKFPRYDANAGVLVETPTKLPHQRGFQPKI